MNSCMVKDVTRGTREVKLEPTWTKLLKSTKVNSWTRDVTLGTREVTLTCTCLWMRDCFQDTSSYRSRRRRGGDDEVTSLLSPWILHRNLGNYCTELTRPCISYIYFYSQCPSISMWNKIQELMYRVPVCDILEAKVKYKGVRHIHVECMYMTNLVFFKENLLDLFTIHMWLKFKDCITILLPYSW